MNLIVNGSELTAEDRLTVASLVALVAPDRAERGTAVALNGTVVPRVEWQSTMLSEGDRVEVLHAIGGG